MRIFGIILWTLVFLTLLVDYFVTRDVLMEDSLYFWLSILIFGNITRKIFIPGIAPVTVIVNLIIIGTAIYAFRYVLLIGWGLGFTGKGISFIYGMVFVLNFAVPIEAAIEIARLRKSA